MDGGAQITAGRSLIKHLGSCNKPARDKALRLLIKTWLPSQSQISDDDMRKLWKGLFYCVWHADKAPVQAELNDRLSSLLLVLETPLAVHYFSVFLLTMRREWTGIDGLRLDKFYLLIRRFIRCFFLLLKKNAWDSELLGTLMNVLEEKAFLADDKLLGNGVNYHIASIFLEELKPSLPVGSEVLDVIFRPFLSVLDKSRDKILVSKVKSNVFDVLLKMGRSLLERKKLGENVDSPKDEIEVFGVIALAMGFSTKLYELGSSPNCIQGNRKVIFQLHEVFFKLDKDLESSKIKISIPEVNVDDEDEVPKLIPIVSNDEEVAEGDVNLSASKPSKRSKKSKKGLDGSKKKSEKGDDEEEVPELIPIVTNETEVAEGGANGSASEPLKHSKKPKKGSDGSKKKSNKGDGLSDGSKKKRRKSEENEDLSNGNDESLTSNGDGNDGNLIDFSETVISNLQMQFEKVAAEAGLDEGEKKPLESPGVSKKKRKRVKNTNGKDSGNTDLNTHNDMADDVSANSGMKSDKKVRFAMKNNVVWKPHTPLPPQSVRLPPSATPRGSALKKGVPPGPVREISSAGKMVKQKKRGVKKIKTVSPAIKRLWKLQTKPL